MVVLYPMGVLPPNCPIQTMTSYLGSVVLVALVALASRNISTTTFAPAYILSRVWLAAEAGVMDQLTLTSTFERLVRGSGSRDDVSLRLGNA
jgi:hypothetical protein